MADNEALKTAVDAALLEQASQPASFTLGDMSQSNRDPRALIELDKHAAAKAAHRFGFGRAVLKPPAH